MHGRHACALAFTPAWWPQAIMALQDCFLRVENANRQTSNKLHNHSFQGVILLFLGGAPCFACRSTLSLHVGFRAGRGCSVS